MKSRATRNQEDAIKCWNEIGSVILGRADKDFTDDMVYRSGTLFDKFKATFRRKPKQAPVTHDYTKMFWGHCLHGLNVFHVEKCFSITGHGPIGMPWKPCIQVGDFIVINSQEGPMMRLKVKKIEYFKDPSDMFSATLKYDGIEK